MPPTPQSTLVAGRSSLPAAAIGLSTFERVALAIGIVEIPLQIDKYFLFREPDASLGAVAGFNVSVTTLSLIVLYVFWMADSARQQSRTWLRPLWGIPMLLYVGIVLLSTTSAMQPILSLFELALLFQAYLLFFYLANRIETHSDVQFCLFALAAAILVECGLIFLASAIGIRSEERILGPLTLTVWGENRHGGTMQSPVLAGSTLALMWLPVAASLLVIRHRHLWRLLLIATAAGIVAILMTQTRGAIVTSATGLIIIGAGMLVRGWLPRWSVLLGAGLIGLSIYPMYHVYKHRFQHGDDQSAASRKHLSLIALDLVSVRPWIGHGAGNCHVAGQTVAGQAEYRAQWYYTIHSKFLLVAVETGLPGLLAFLWVLGNGFRHGISTWRTRVPGLSVIGLALAAALAGHALHMTVDIFNSRTQVQMLWCILGIAAAAYKISHARCFARALPAAEDPGPWRLASRRIHEGLT